MNARDVRGNGAASVEKFGGQDFFLVLTWAKVSSTKINTHVYTCQNERENHKREVMFDLIAHNPSPHNNV